MLNMQWADLCHSRSLVSHSRSVLNMQWADLLWLTRDLLQLQFNDADMVLTAIAFPLAFPQK